MKITKKQDEEEHCMNSLIKGQTIQHGKNGNDSKMKKSIVEIAKKKNQEK